MSFLNLEFLKENFYEDKIVFFDIGSCDLWDTKDFVKTLPKATFYAFEPFKGYYEISLERSFEYGVNFFNYAVSDVNGDVLFYPSEKQGQQEQLQSSSIFKKTNKNIITYGEPYMVKSITLETFCDEHNISPDFIHIDVEGSEFNVFKKLGNHRPKGIWIEMNGHENYENGRNVKGNFDYELDELLKSYGYELAAENAADSLYLHKDVELKNRNYKL
jgi:FkbM family methyltransferase